MTRHILGLFHGQPRVRAFRRHTAPASRSSMPFCAAVDGRGAKLRRNAKSRAKKTEALSRSIGAVIAPHDILRRHIARLSLIVSSTVAGAKLPFGSCLMKPAFTTLSRVICTPRSALSTSAK